MLLKSPVFSKDQFRNLLFPETFPGHFLRISCFFFSVFEVLCLGLLCLSVPCIIMNCLNVVCNRIDCIHLKNPFVGHLGIHSSASNLFSPNKPVSNGTGLGSELWRHYDIIMSFLLICASCLQDGCCSSSHCIFVQGRKYCITGHIYSYYLITKENLFQKCLWEGSHMWSRKWPTFKKIVAF